MIDVYKYSPFACEFEEGDRVYVVSIGMSWTDLRCLDELLNTVKKEGMVVYEIGSWTGASTCCMAEIVKKCHGRMVAVDNFKGASVDMCRATKTIKVRKLLENNLKRFGVSDVVTIKECSSDEAVLDVPDESIDLLFIDGDHRYSQIKRDLDNWYPKIKKGGIISGHDCNGIKYDEKYLEVDANEKKIHHGIIKAVTEKFNKVLVFIKGNTAISTIWFHVKEDELSDKTIQSIHSGERMPQMCSL